MIVDAQKQQRRAKELIAVWDTYFPSLRGKAPIEFWMPLLDEFSIGVLGQAIRKCAKKKLTVAMDEAAMMTYIANISEAIHGDRLAAGIADRRPKDRVGSVPTALEAHGA